MTAKNFRIVINQCGKKKSLPPIDIDRAYNRNDLRGVMENGRRQTNFDSIEGSPKFVER